MNPDNNQFQSTDPTQSANSNSLLEELQPGIVKNQDLFRNTLYTSLSSNVYEQKPQNLEQFSQKNSYLVLISSFFLILSILAIAVQIIIKLFK